MQSSSPTFKGFARESRAVGVRNHVLVLPSVICSREVAIRIAERVPGAVPAPHDLGCGQIGADEEQTHKTLAAVGTNPNVAGVVVVGLGCEQAQSGDVAEEIREYGVPTRSIAIQDAGGVDACVNAGTRRAEELADRTDSKTEVDLGDVTLGVVSSDYRETTVTSVEPLVGQMAAAVLDAGGRVVVAGMERFTPHVSAARDLATDSGVAQDLEGIVEAYRSQAARTPALDRDVRAWEFDELTTLWDDRPVDEVVAYGEQASLDSGVAIIDSPARFEEAATALTAAGAQVIVHATAEGIPTGHPITPVLKLTGGRTTYDALPADIDLYAPSTAPEEALATLGGILQGDDTCAETNGLTEFAIAQVGPSV